MSIPGVEESEWEAEHLGTFIGCAGPCRQGRNVDERGLCPCPRKCYRSKDEEEMREPDTFTTIHFWGTTLAAFCFLAALVGWVVNRYY